MLILKIVGLTLLFILCFALICIVAVIFAPLRYRFKSDNTDKTFILFNAFILFKMFGFSYFYKNGSEAKNITLFWKSYEYEKIFKSKKNKAKKINVKKNKIKDIKINSKQVDTNKKNISKKSNRKKINVKNKKTGNNINKIKEKFIYFVNIKDKDKILNYILVLISKLLKALKNEKFNIDIKFGFDEPDKTGLTLGFGCILNSMLPVMINFKPDFENECFEYNAEIKGKTSFFLLFTPLIQFILKKPIWNIFFNWKDEKNERI